MRLPPVRRWLLGLVLAGASLTSACTPEPAVSRAAIIRALTDAREAHRLKEDKHYADALTVSRRAFAVIDTAARAGQVVPHTAVLSDHLQLLDFNHRYAELLTTARLASGWQPAQGDGDTDREELLANAEAAALQALGRREEAIARYRQAMAIVERSEGPQARSIATYLGYIAETQLDMGDLHGAKTSLAQAARLLDPPDFKSRSTMSLVELTVRLAVATGHTDVAMSLARRAVDYGEAMGRAPDDQAVTVAELAQVHYARGQYASAVALHRRALPVLQAHLGEAHPLCAREMEWLAGALAAAGQREEAQRLMQRSAELAEEVLGPDHPDAVARRERLARLRGPAPGQAAASRRLSAARTSSAAPAPT